MSDMIKVQMTVQEMSTVLAALALWKCSLELSQPGGDVVPIPVEDFKAALTVASDAGEYPALSPMEVDALSLRVNGFGMLNEDTVQNDRERAAILAGLRFYQWHLSRGNIERYYSEFSGIASDDETLDPLSADEIDELAEEINCNEGNWGGQPCR